MLPTHRNMKKGEYINDDKYMKSKRSSKKQNSSRLLLLVILITVCVLYYIYQKDVPLSHDISSPPPSYADDIKQQPQPQQPAEAAIADKLEEQELLEEFEEQHILEDEIDPIKEKPAAAQQQPSTPFLFTQTPPPEALHPQDPTMAEKQQRVVDAFRHAWKGYSNDIFGMDEYRPISHSGSNWAPGGVGLMICDSLDTMMLMNLTDEYNQAREWIATELDFDKDQDVNVFETTIRVLGGLLSAYHLSNNDPLYLEKAIDLGNRLYPAFNTPSGVPYSGVVLSNGRGASPGSSSTAEATTVQMEFKYLSHLSGDKKFWDAAEKVMDHVATLSHTLPALDGLVPIYIDPVSGQFSTKEIRLGSRGDSYYEYLLKLYLQTNKQETRYRERYDDSVKGIKKHLTSYSYPNKYLYFSEITNSDYPTQLHPKMDHLVCFIGGNFVLGVTEGASLDEKKELSPVETEDVSIGKEITRTCYEMYNMTATGLASEIVYFNTNPDAPADAADMEIHRLDKHNLLRPETVETLFLMWRLTGDEIYREWGWEIFESFEKYTKLPEGGFFALKDSTVDPPIRDDRMDTFFMAETLKYLYLLFSPNDIIPLEKYVFNTEGHPLPVFSPA